MSLLGGLGCGRSDPPQVAEEPARAHSAVARSTSPDLPKPFEPAPAASAGTDESGRSPSPPPSTQRERDGMLLVPAGRVVMGADDGGEMDEHPAHPVTVAAFYLDATEVTNAAYAECVQADACHAPNPANAEVNHVGPDRRFRGSEQPVSSISWHDAHAYCARVGKRLPSEAEWERAARGDDVRRYPWGDESPTAERAAFHASVTSDVGTHPSGDGPFGHHDLAGNVWEWVEDVYDPFAYTRADAERGGGATCEASLRAFDELRRTARRGFTGSNPIPTECERVLRGGAFNYTASGLRVTNRVHHPPRFRLVMSGFRCAANVE